MPRTVEQAFAYFPLDSNFFTNKKVKALRRAHGTVGVITYIYILCLIYQHGYYYRVNDIEQFAFDVAEDIANTQLAKVAAQVRESIDYMAGDVQLLDSSCLAMGILTSVSVQEQYSATIAKFKRKAQIKEYNLLTPLDNAPKNEINAEENAINAEEIAINSEFMHRKRKGNRKREISLTRDKEKPTLEDIVAYCKERKNHVDPQRFFDYYSANGWKIGGQPIQDWQAAVRRWETNGVDKKASDSAPQGITYGNYTEDELNDMFTLITEDDE